MTTKILIVEDQFVEAHDLQLMLEKAGYIVCGIARSVELAREILKEENPDLVLLDIFLKGNLTGIDFAQELNKVNKPFIFLSANSNEDILQAAKSTEPYGFIVKPFREKDLIVTLEIAKYRYEHGLESKYRKEGELLRKLEETISCNTGWEQKLLNIGTTLQQRFPFDYLTAGFNNLDKISHVGCSFLRTGFDEYQSIGLKELLTISKLTMDQLMALYSVNTKGEPAAFFNENDFENISRAPSFKKVFKEIFKVRSLLELPLQMSNGESFSFCFYSRRPDAYTTEHLNSFYRLQHVWTKSIEEMLSSLPMGVSANSRVKNSPELPGKKPKIAGFEGIIGKSHLLLSVFDQITQVAPFDTSVLILGESGTGKEGIADCIHNLSPRKGKPFIKINCATLPASLIESELFGHEKGSFTGATEKRIGKFEQANGGSIFLDEIGEMPIDLQVKLLRVLQEKEIESIGGRSTIKINVRIIAATNRNLEKEVADGRFRLDLYYRLNIFPILLPPLRDRKEDIHSLAIHFINAFNKKAAKNITGLSDKLIAKLMEYTWPGNIRELEHLIERAVLLAKGSTIENIDLPSIALTENYPSTVLAPVKTIFENERDNILCALKQANGKIWGIGGAAELLNIPPTTLSSKMKKLGIKKMSWIG